MYLFASPCSPRAGCDTRSIFFCGVRIQRFPSLRLISLSRLKNPVCPNISSESIKKKRRFHAFPNANKCAQCIEKGKRGGEATFFFTIRPLIEREIDKGVDKGVQWFDYCLRVRKVLVSVGKIGVNM